MTKLLLISFSIILSKYKINFHIIIIRLVIIILIININFNSINISIYSIIFDNITSLIILLSIIRITLIILSSNNIKKIFNFIYPIILILLLTFSSSNLFIFYIFFETVLIPTIILISKTGNQPERLQAGIYLLIYTITASLPLLICLISIKNNFSFYWAYISIFKFKLYFLLILAFLVKIPIFITHLWLPKAHVEAPLEGSIILAAVLLKLGGYGLIRFIPLCQNINYLKIWIIRIRILGASITRINCIRQKDMKALIAYSSVAHIALTLIRIFTINKIGLTGAILIIIAHGLSSSALFLLVNDLYLKIHSRNIILFKGLISLSPNINFWWFIFLALNISAPPSINTLREIFIISRLISWNLITIIPVALASFLVASFCVSLFINISHNKNNIKFFKRSTQKIFLSLFSHSLPLLIIIGKPEIIIT